MRIGDIYFRQMDKPDRDHAKAIHAEEEYRRMLTDYPDSKLVPQARQRLREVQEALATREASIGDYYATHQNWPATIARYQTVIDTYPQYSHMDDVLIGLGDAYAAQSTYIRTQNLPEAGKARLLTAYDQKAANAYREVVVKSLRLPARGGCTRSTRRDECFPSPTPRLIRLSSARRLRTVVRNIACRIAPPPCLSSAGRRQRRPHRRSAAR